MLNLLSKSGGLLYHFKARSYSQTIWGPYINNVYSWLDAWKPKKDKLLLIGPSSGYSISNRFLNRFKHIDAIEIDPLARLLFSYSHDKKIHWDKQDYFKFSSNNNFNESFNKISEKYADHAILFCNFLGQVSFLISNNEDRFLNFESALQEFVKERSWASYHDIFSINAKAKPIMIGDVSHVNLTVDINKNNVQFAKWLQNFIEPPKNHEVVVNDHKTFNFFEKTKNINYFAWELQPRQTNIIEAITSN